MKKIFITSLDLKKFENQKKGETIAPFNVGDIEIKLFKLNSIKL